MKLLANKTLRHFWPTLYSHQWPKTPLDRTIPTSD